MESLLESKMRYAHAHIRLPSGSWVGLLVSSCLLPVAGSEKSLDLRK